MQEIRNFIGIVYMMSVYKLSATRMYWNNTTRIERIATVMTCNRWEAIKNHIHFNNNDTIPPDNIDKLFKIRPLLSSLLTKFQRTPIDYHLSLDEQIVPFKGKSGLKQYNPKKPKKWRYKIFVLSDYKGIVYNFQIYDGPLLAMPGNKDIGTSGNIVMQLASVIPKNQGHKLCFDNWFTSVNLQVEPEKIGIHSLGTVRRNRIRGCVFSSEKELKAKRRGTFEEKTTVVDNIKLRATVWLDNRAVTLLTTFVPANHAQQVERYDRKHNSIVQVGCPSVVPYYNSSMGGVDLVE